jgi:hypothetical protein
VFEAEWTETDRLMALSVATVTETICRAFIDASVVVDVVDPEVGAHVERFASLKKKLDWAGWLKCGRCAADEVCFTAMWPVGAAKDHWQPSCQNLEHLTFENALRGDYWKLGMEGGPW